MKTYKFKWKRKLIWHSAKVMGHSYVADQNKMVLYFEDGSLEEIAHWTDCSVKLGTDWVLATKQRMEEQSGQAVPLTTRSK